MGPRQRADCKKIEYAKHIITSVIIIKSNSMIYLSSTFDTISSGIDLINI